MLLVSVILLSLDRGFAQEADARLAILPFIDSSNNNQFQELPWSLARAIRKHLERKLAYEEIPDDDVARFLQKSGKVPHKMGELQDAATSLKADLILYGQVKATKDGSSRVTAVIYSNIDRRIIARARTKSSNENVLVNAENKIGPLLERQLLDYFNKPEHYDDFEPSGRTIEDIRRYRGSLQFSFGPLLPVSDFGSDSATNQSAAYASTGYDLGIRFKYVIGSIVGITLAGHYSRASFNTTAFERDLTSLLTTTTGLSSSSSTIAEAYGFFTFNIGLVLDFYYINLGVAPGLMNYNGSKVNSSVTIPGVGSTSASLDFDSATALGIDLLAGFEIPFSGKVISLNLIYRSANFDTRGRVAGGGYTSFELKYSAIIFSLGAGITF